MKNIIPRPGEIVTADFTERSKQKIASNGLHNSPGNFYRAYENY